MSSRPPNPHERLDVAGPKGPHAQARRLQLLLFFILVVIILTLVRYEPISDLSAAPASFSGPWAYQYYGILKTGGSSVEPPVYSPFSSGTTPQRGEVLYIRYEAILALITGDDRFAGTLITASLAESISLTAIFLLVGWMWGRTYQPDRGGPHERTAILSAIVFAAGTPTVILYLIGWNAPYGWYFVILTPYVLSKTFAKTRFRFLSLFFVAIVYSVYTTPALVLTILIVGLGIFRGGSWSRLAVFSGVYGVAYIVFLSQLLFGTIVKVPNALSAVLQFEDRASGLSFIAGNPLPIRILDFAVFGLVAAPLVALVLSRVSGSRPTSDTRTTYAYVFCLAIFGLGAAAELGIVSGVFRTSEYVALFSMLLIPAAFRTVRPKARRVVAGMLAAAVLLSVCAYVLSPTLGGQYLSLQEATGTSWIVQHRQDDAVVFTDFRLAGPLVAQGYLRVVGVSDVGSSPSIVNNLLTNIYYSESPCLAEKSLLSVRTEVTNQTASLLMFSTRMTDLFPAIRGYDYSYQPAPENFASKFASLPSLAEVYSNGETTIYARVSLDSGLC